MVEYMPLSDMHLLAAHALSQKVGWPHRTEDWRQMLALGQGAVAMDGDTPLGTVLWWRHADAATLGMVIVDGTARKQGIGAMLVKRALKATEGLPVFLYGTDMALRSYAALGFEECGLVHQFQGIVHPTDVPDGRVARASAQDVQSIVALDKAARGWARGPFLRALIDHGAQPWCLKDGGHVQAYALERLAGRGRVIGPIVAKSSEMARGLVCAIASNHAGQFMRVDTDPELGLAQILPDLGFTHVGKGTAMLRGNLRTSLTGEAKLFGLASQAYG